MMQARIRVDIVDDEALARGVLREYLARHDDIDIVAECPNGFDAVKAIAPVPVVEVHLTDISSREEFRHVSYAAPYCLTQIKGQQARGYILAMDAILEHIHGSGN